MIEQHLESISTVSFFYLRQRCWWYNGFKSAIFLVAGLMVSSVFRPFLIMTRVLIYIHKHFNRFYGWAAPEPSS